MYYLQWQLFYTYIMAETVHWEKWPQNNFRAQLQCNFFTCGACFPKEWSTFSGQTRTGGENSAMICGFSSRKGKPLNVEHVQQYIEKQTTNKTVPHLTNT